MKRNEKGFFSDGFFYGKLFRTALPITLQALLVSLVAACDAFMLGRVDQDSMAAVFAGLCLFCPRALMRIFAGDPALVSIGAGYLRIAGISVSL